MITTERGKYYCGGKISGLNVPKREFECKSPAEVRELLPSGTYKRVYVYTYTKDLCIYICVFIYINQISGLIVHPTLILILINQPSFGSHYCSSTI
jgi:hypothetical protein